MDAEKRRYSGGEPMPRSSLGARPVAVGPVRKTCLRPRVRGQRYDLPVPLWLYLYGAGSAVLLSFFLIGYFAGKGEALRRYPRFDLLRVRAFRATLASRPFVSGLRLVSVALFATPAQAPMGPSRARTSTGPGGARRRPTAQSRVGRA